MSFSANIVNHANLPPWVIGSRHFASNPQPLELCGVKYAQRRLFERLDEIADPVTRALTFHDYMCVAFQLHQWRDHATETARKALKNSYLRFLRGWMFDSNSVEGAVLKAWAESRFGLPPTFHKHVLTSRDDPAYQQFAVDRMRGMVRTSAIYSQLDLLFEYVQYELGRRHPDTVFLDLYRGVYDFQEHHVIEQTRRNRYVVQLNSVNSFTEDFERAWEFGTRVLKTRYPRYKVVYKAGILPSSLLSGEAEVIVLGGECEVDVLSGG